MPRFCRRELTARRARGKNCSRSPTIPPIPRIARASAAARVDRIVSAGQLEHLRSLLADPDPLVRRAAAQAYAGAPPQARLDLLPLIDDAILDVRLEATQTLATAPAQIFDADARRRLDKGIEEYLASQRSNSDRPEAHHNIAILLMQLGRSGEAEAEFKQALALDPSFVPAAVTLADLYRGQKREAEAEPVLRAIIARDPSAAAAHFALGLWLVRAGRREEAWGELKRAAELAPEDAHFGYVLGVAVASAGDRPQGVQILRNVLRRHAYDRETLSGLASFEAAMGHRDEAVAYATRLAELEPQDPDARALLEQVRQ